MPTNYSQYDTNIKLKLIEYYKERLLYYAEIDVDKLVIQIEEFKWQNAVYRIDIFFSDEISFIPWNSNYVMAHRMWMTISGEIVKSEPIYSNSNFQSDENQTHIPKENTGFFPGLKYFEKDLLFCHKSLASAKKVFRYETESNDSPSMHLDVDGGMNDLKGYHASIIESEKLYTIRHDVEHAKYYFIEPFNAFSNPSGFAQIYMIMIYDIDKWD